MNRIVAVGLVLLAAGALAIRLPDLDQRPLHTDESVHTFKFRDLLERGVYRYDPNEFHGPTLYDATLPVAWLSGARTYAQTNERTYRLVPVLFGAGLILVLFLLRDGLGPWPTLLAGVGTALSPAMVFYSRYYIHEMLLLFFTLLLLGAGWRYSRSPCPAWAGLAGTALGLMQATKETFVFPVAAMAIALLLAAGWEHWVGGGMPPLRTRIRLWHLGLALGAAVFVSVLLFSSFFTHASGPLDSIRTYLPWFRRAEGQSPHTHPWYYYLSLLAWTHRGRGPVWTEGLILALAAVGFAAGLNRRSYAWCSAPFLRFLGFYTLVLTGIYSVVPYKTPWCLLGFLQGMILLAGAGAVALLVWVRWRWLQVVLATGLAAAAVHLGVEAWRASYPYSDNPRNPYVYAHTLSDVCELADTMEGLAKVSFQGHDMLIKVMAPGLDYWPLPWYLRHFKLDRIGWYAAVPAQPQAPVVIASTAFAEKLKAGLGETHAVVGFFGLRPGVFLQLYVEKGLWQRFQDAAGRQPLEH